MSSYNKVILIGRLTRDPELRYTPNGKAVASFSLAIDRNRGQGQERETDFIDCVVWQQSAEFASKYATKGRLVCVEGRLQTRSWEDKETGQKRKAVEVVCSDLRLLDKRDSAGGYDGGSSFEGAAPRETVYSGSPASRGPAAPSGDPGFQDDDIPF
ncbi:MAG: single-stranded DNA-binding protein [Proteobacteria bacterium]|nr:single-stranded DNA-binding protein [Pseudomonadota bacterium]